MSTIKETFYIVFKDKPVFIPSYISGSDNTFVPAGYYFVPYPMQYDKIVFQGSIRACVNVLKGLESFSLN